MKFNAKLWLSVIILQLAYGLAVFALTRTYYKGESRREGLAQQVTSNQSPLSAPSSSQPSIDEGRGLGVMRPFPPPPDSQATGDIPPTVGDINDLIRLADDYFERQQYAQAAAAYAQAVSLAPQQVEIYNNLGISLHYAGRSQEAIGKLKQGVAIDPHHQRIWLTLGFVQARAGNTPEARAALERAIAMDPRSEIGLEAKRLADALEQPVP